MSFLRLRRKFVLGTKSPGVASLQIQPRNQTVNGTGGGTGTVIAGLPFLDTMESGSFSLWDAVGGTVTNTTAEAFEGTRSASTTVAGGQQSDNYLEYHFGDHQGVGGTPTGMNDLWCRFAHKWASNWTEGAGVAAQKLWLLNSHNPASNRRRYQVTFNIFGPAASGQTSGQYFFDIYRWNEDGSFNQTIHNIPLPPFLRVLGRWEEFVFRIRMNNPGVSDGQLDCWVKTEGQSSYTQLLARTNLNMRDATAFTPNRLIGLSNFDTITTRSGARYWDSIYLGQEEVDLSDDPSGGDNDGTVFTDYANWNPDAAQLISVDVNPTVPRAVGGGAIATYTASHPWWNGNTGVYEFRPPTSADSYSGFGAINLWRNAAKIIKQGNWRYEFMMSDAFCANTVGHPKLLIMRVYPNFNSGNPGTPARPMLFVENMLEADNTALHLQNTLFLCHSQGTFRYFSTVNEIPGPTEAQSNSSTITRYANQRQPFYFSANPGVDGAGNPIIDASEVVTVEIRVNVVATASEPNGFIGYRLYRRNGQIFERGCAWNWDQNYSVSTPWFIADIDVFGGGYFNDPNPTSTGLWMKVGRRLTFASNLNPTVGRAWIGPATGFFL